MNKVVNNKYKKGSGTLVVVISSLVFIMYITSTYSDVRHLKNMQNKYETAIKSTYNTRVNIIENEYDLVQE